MGPGLAHSRFAPALLLGLLWLAAPPASAQSQGLVVRDGTLGSAPAGVVAPGPDDLGTADYLIRADLGEQRGGNLFHSFARFSIGSGERATFTDQGSPNPGAIDNVISRVTGVEHSQIDGMLHSTIPGADVWLLNPSGVVFGEGARLSVPASFHASTGDYLGFGQGDLVRFYSDPSGPSVLATAPPAAFGFLGEASVASVSLDGAKLSVPEGETLSLVGGDVVLDGATLEAENGRVNLAAVTSAGEVVPAPADAPEPLEMRGFGALGEVRLQARDGVGSRVDAGGESPGSVFIRGGRLFVQGGAVAGQARSLVLAQNSSTVPAESEGPGSGLISVQASESVLVDNGLLSVSTHAAGNAGTLHVAAPEVTFQNGPSFDIGIPQESRAGASAQTTSSGAGGKIRIDAGSLTITNRVGVSAAALGSSTMGDAGTVEIFAHSVELSDRSTIGAPAFGKPVKAGTITIDLGDDGRLRVDGGRDDGKPQPYAYIITNGTGTPGTIDIRGGLVEVLNGGAINSSCQAGCASKVGDPDRPEHAGRIGIYVDRLVVQGSAISVNAFGSGSGDAGTIEIEAGSIELSEGGSLVAGTSKEGNAGTINIRDADSLVIRSGGFINAQTSGATATGNGGTIEITARTLAIERGGSINAGSSQNSRGNAGTIEVRAGESILLDHESGVPFSLLEAAAGTLAVTGIFSATGGGDGRLITLDAPDITIKNGAIVATSTVGGGDAGNVRLSGNRIHILGGGFVDSTSVPNPSSPFEPGGAAGSVTIQANELIEVVGRRSVMPGDTPYEEWSRVGSAALGSGAPGEVMLAAPRIVVDGGAVATTAVASASARGTIAITAGEMLVANGGRIDASTFIADQGGSIDVTATDSIVIAGTGGGIASRTGAQGKGGDVALRAPRIEVKNGAGVSAESTPASPDLGEVGEIFASLLHEGLIRAPDPRVATGDAGSIALAASQLVHLDDGEITTSSPHGPASGGDITIDPVFVILENDSRIVATADAGHGGRIRIAADNFFQFPGSVVNAASGNPELSGTVEIKSPDVDLAGTLAPLPSAFLDAASLMRERCAARRSGERAGSFAVRGPGGIPAEPDGWLRAPVVLADTAATAAATAAQPVLFASTPASLHTPGACP